MRRLNRPMLATSPMTAVLISAVLGVLTASTANACLKAGNLGWWLLLAAGSALWFGALWLLTSAYSPRVDADPVAGRLRVRGREYPLSALRAATRSLSSSSRASYLTYRFALDDGRRFRLIAGGRPFRGLEPESLRLLRDVVSRSALAEPDGPSPGQQRLSSSLQTDGRAVPVGREAILRDIDELLGVARPAERPIVPGPAAPADQERADAVALELVQRHTGSLQTVRRSGGLAAALGGMLLLGLVLTFALDESAHWADWSPENPIAVAIGVVGAVLLAAGSLIWMLAADAAVRRIRTLADAHWDAADATARAAGLPAPYLSGDLSGARRTSTFLAYATTILGFFAVVFALAGLAIDEARPVLPPALVLSAVFIVTAVFAWHASIRDRRRTAERVVLRGGTRLAGPA